MDSLFVRVLVAEPIFNPVLCWHLLCSFTVGQSSEDVEEKRWRSSREREGRTARRTQMAHYRWDHVAPSRLIRQSVPMTQNSFRGALNLCEPPGAFCGVFTRCWPYRCLGIVAVSTLVLQAKRFIGMLVVGWRSNQTFWCLRGRSSPTHWVSMGFQRAGGCFRSHLTWCLCKGERNSSSSSLQIGPSLSQSRNKRDLDWN